MAKINADSEHLDYLNGLATFKDKNTVICSKKTEIIKEFIKSGLLPENEQKEVLYQ